MYVEVDLSDVDDDELIDELKSRGYKVAEDTTSDFYDRIEKIYHLRRQGVPSDHLVDQAILDYLGKVI